MSKSPPTRILFECIVKQLPAHDRFTQNIQSRCRLAIRIVSKLINRLRIGHNRTNPGLISSHIAPNVTSTSTTGRVIPIKLFFGEILNKRIQTFIHPSPLPLIRIDDHGKEIVPNFMNDYADHTNLGSLCIGAISLRTSTIETNHRVFHTNPLGVHTDGHWIRVIDCELRIRLERLGYGLCRVLLPQRVSFLGVKTHRQW